jgi:hypothetical protein
MESTVAQPTYLTLEETAALFRVRPDTIRRWVKDEEWMPKPVRINHRWLFPAAEVRSLPERREKEMGLKERVK